MPAEFTFGAALLVGLLGSSHCLGMCSGIVAALNMGLDEGLEGRHRSVFVYQLSYNLGRIGSYVLVGLLAGGLGAGLAQLGVSPVAGRLFAAAFMIALGLYLADWWRGLAILERWGARLWRHIQPIAQRLLPIKSPAHAFLLGALWGWLPCGLVYAAVAWSLTTGDAAQGALLMLGFGLGTLPAMLLAGKVIDYLRPRLNAPLIRSLAGATIIVFGLYSGYSGLSQGVHRHNHHALSSSPVFLVSDFEPGRVPAILRRVS